MKTVSSLVKKTIENKPFLLEAISKGIIHFGNLAATIKPKIAEELGKEVTESSIIMALRRYTAEIKTHLSRENDIRLQCEIIMKTNICDFNIVKTPSLLLRLKELYSLASIERGDFLNITIGNNEISIAISQKYLQHMQDFLEKEELLNTQTDLVALTTVFSGDFLHTPGIIYQALQKLAWNSINVYEIVSTLTELTVIIEKVNSGKAYELLSDYIEELQ